MLARRQTHLDMAVSLVVTSLFILVTVVQSESMSDNYPTHGPPLSENMLTTELYNGNMEEPRVLRMHSPCREEHVDYCLNGGQCIYPQDTNQPFCECTSSHSGDRCMHLVAKTQTRSDYEGVIIIIVVVALLILAIGLIYFYCFRRRCGNWQEGLIKHGSSENSV